MTTTMLSSRLRTIPSCVIRQYKALFSTSPPPLRPSLQANFFSRNAATSTTRPSLPRLLLRSYHSAQQSTPDTAMPALWTLIALNTGIFAAWQYGAYTRSKPIVGFLNENFVLSTANLDQGRYHTLLFSALSHQELSHFLFNMFSLHAFGSLLSFVPGIGASHIFSLAITSALAGSAGWLYHRQTKVAAKPDLRFGPNAIPLAATTSASALGASGAVMGMAASAALLTPRAPMNMMFIPIAIPLWVLACAYPAVDLYYLNSEKTRTGHAAHLAGAAAGVLYYGLFLRRFGRAGRTFGSWR